MMTHRDPNRLGDRIIFFACAIGLLVFSFQAAYDYGVKTGEAKCAPVVAVPKKSMYDMTPKQLRRMIRYEQAKGGVL